VLLVLDEQRPQHPRTRPGSAAHRHTVQVDQLLLGGDRRLELDRVAAGAGPAAERIGAGEQVRGPAAGCGEQQGQRGRRGEQHPAPRHDVGHTGKLPYFQEAGLSSPSRDGSRPGRSLDNHHHAPRAGPFRAEGQPRIG
jgi:hypothetical protein